MSCDYCEQKTIWNIDEIAISLGFKGITLASNLILMFFVMYSNTFYISLMIFITFGCKAQSFEQITLNTFLSTEIEKLNIHAKKINIQIVPVEAQVPFMSCFKEQGRMAGYISIPQLDWSDLYQAACEKLYIEEYVDTSLCKLLLRDSVNVQHIKRKTWLLTVSKSIIFNERLCYVEIRLTGRANSYYCIFEYNLQEESLRDCVIIESF